MGNVSLPHEGGGRVGGADSHKSAFVSVEAIPSYPRVTGRQVGMSQGRQSRQPHLASSPE
ncbi:MAG: hypothetical protein ACI3XR_01105 [Eubacteriales bacterium]